MFPSSIGTPKNPSNLNKRFKEVLDAVEIEHARLHDLRHGMLTTANNVLHADGKVLEKIGGHSHTTQMGMKVYVHAPKEAEPYQEIAKGSGRLYGARKASRQDDFPRSAPTNANPCSKKDGEPMKYEGVWHILEMDLWDEDYFNMEVQAFIRIDSNGKCIECF